MGLPRTSLPLYFASSRSSQDVGFAPPISPLKRLVLVMMPKIPKYQPVQLFAGSFDCAATAVAFGETYVSSKPSLPSPSWNDESPPMKMSAFGLAFSARIRVCSSPAAASGSRSTSTPVTAALNAFTNSLFVDSLSAEYTEMRPDGFGDADAATVPATVGVGDAAVGAPPHAAAAAVIPTPARNVRLSSFGVIPTPSFTGSKVYSRIEIQSMRSRGAEGLSEQALVVGVERHFPLPERARHDVQVVQVVARRGRNGVKASRHEDALAVTYRDALVEGPIGGVDPLHREPPLLPQAVVIGLLQCRLSRRIV